jgi:hypothetical protein
LPPETGSQDGDLDEVKPTKAGPKPFREIIASDFKIERALSCILK